MNELDRELFQAIHIGWHSAWLDPVFTFFSYLGLGIAQALLALILIRWRSTRYFVLPLLVTVAASGLVAQAIKNFVVERERPSHLLIANPQEAHLYNSFPSGHATTSFATAFLLLFVTAGTKRAWVGYAALVGAAMVGLSRIYRGIHWPSDVLEGAFLGCMTAAVVYLILDRLGHWLHLDQHDATLTGRETAKAD